MISPEAYISHQTAQRLRIKIPSQKKDTAFLSYLKDKFVPCQGFDTFEINPVTGSILFVSKKKVDVEAILTFAEENRLFKLRLTVPKKSAVSKTTLAQKVVKPVQEIQSRIHRSTGGYINLASMAFFYLMGSGIYQVKEGNLYPPPWYNAFWIAYQLYKSAGLGRSGQDPVP